MTVCYATMERSAAQARWETLHEERPYHNGTHRSWAKEMSPEHPYYRDSGVNIWVAPRDINPDDDFLGGRVDDDDEDPGTGGNQPGA